MSRQNDMSMEQQEDRSTGRLPRVAVVGRPNVGKSTLVNRILGRRAAITQEVPGVTRDRVAYQADWSGRRFQLVDTGGWEPKAAGLQARIVAQAERAMADADLLLFVVDATTGITEEDAAVASRLRRGQVPVLLVANKVDSAAAEPQVADLWSLGLGEPLAVSSLHGRGSGDLLDAVIERLGTPAAAADEPEVPALAIVGRPNVGKSSLLNRLAGQELAIVDETPGTTRDTVDSIVGRAGRSYRLVDTAGMRRSFQQAEGADYFAFVRSLEAVDRADVALLVLEAPLGVAEQDQKVTGRGVEKIWGLADRVLAERSRRIPTAALNQWLGQATERTPPPPVRGRSIKARYATQARVDPPEVVLFTSGQLTPSYRRYLERDLRRTFGFEGTPVRLVIRVRARERP